MLKVSLIIIAVAIIAMALLVVIASQLADRTVKVKNLAQAKANGERLLKDSKIILAVGAHPDDLEYYTGGTLGVLAAEGKTVIGVLSADKSRIQSTRRAEVRVAAGIIGYKPVFLGHPERDFEGGLSDKDKAEIRKELKDIIRKYNVDTVLAYDYAEQAPIYHHVDHIATGKEAQAAAREAGVKHVYLYSSGAPNTIVSISSVTDKKSAAMAAHVSQHNKWYFAPLRLFFSWARPAWSDSGEETQGAATSTAASDNHNFGNTESFRKL